MLTPSDREGDHQRELLAAEQRSRLTNPQGASRSAVVVGRVELFGPDMDVDLVNRLRPVFPAYMESTPSPEPEYRELRIIDGRKKEYRITPKVDNRLPPLDDFGVIYSGWQAVGRSWRPIVILEGVSALGTIGAVKAFCSPDCFPDALAGIDGFFLVYEVRLKLRARGRDHNERSLIREDQRKATAILPWHWDDIIIGKLKYRQVVAPIYKRNKRQFAFLGTALRKCGRINRERLRLVVLEHLVSKPEKWIDVDDVLATARCQEVPGGPRLALKQILDGLVAQGVVIERTTECFRQLVRHPYNIAPD
ncbi:MAG: hypothetical protein ACLQOO_20845 [Terriglobia bacterium]